MKESKKHANVVFIGNVDAGKDYVIATLLTQFKRKEPPPKEKVIQPRTCLNYNWVLDDYKGERERGITIDINIHKLETSSCIYTIINVPGHRDFIKNTITGISQADIAILVISASSGEFEAGIGQHGTTREHLLLSYTLGIRQLLVCVNKMDAPSFAQSRYEEIQNEAKPYLTRVGYNRDKVAFIPVSTKQCDNITERSANMQWWKGATLLEALDSIQQQLNPSILTDKPLRIPIQNIYKIGGIGIVVVGRILTGVLAVGDEIIFAPSGACATVKSIEMHYCSLQEAGPGSFIGFNIKSNNALLVRDLHRGCVAGSATTGAPKAAKEFRAQIIVMDHPTEFREGYSPVLHIHTGHVTCTISKIESSIDKRTGKVIWNNPPALVKGAAAIVTIVPNAAICVEAFKEFPSLGRFVLRDMKRTVAVGIILAVTPI